MTSNNADRSAVKRPGDRYNIADLLIMDHHWIKKCIEVIKDEEEDMKERIKFAKSFLDTLKKHSDAEKKSVYAALVDFSKVRSNILEAEIEHSIVDAKVKALTTRMEGKRSIDEEMQAELKVLCELVEHHLKEEEREMIPKIKKALSKEILNDMGREFMKLRGFTAKDLEDYPDLQEEVEMWSGKSPRVSGQFLNKVHQYVDNLTH